MPDKWRCTRAEYTSAGAWSEFAQLLGTSLPKVMTNSCLNVPVADGAHPVVVVSHGFTGTFTNYTFLTEDLASRGYVVASVDHTYEATAASPIGDFTPLSPPVPAAYAARGRMRAKTAISRLS